MKIKAKTKECQLTIKAKASFGEIILERELDRFYRAYIRGFLRPKLINKRMIEFTGPIGVSLYERLKKPMSKRDFLFILEQIVVAVQKLKSNNLSPIHLITDIHYVYINEITREIQFLYIPLSEKNDSSDMLSFIDSIVYSANIISEEDKECVSQFKYFINNLLPFDVAKIELFVAKEDKSVVEAIKKQHPGQSGFMTDSHIHYYEHYEKKNFVDEDGTSVLEEDDETDVLQKEPMSIMAEDNDTTGLLTEDEEATGLLTEDNEATGLLTEDDEATGFLVDNRPYVHYPTLLRVSTGETIRINKAVFRIGKDQTCTHYHVSDNIAVSRKHVDIITRGNNYFVLDLHSRNHTYINSREIPTDCETPIFDGDRLRLGNEDFIFNL